LNKYFENILFVIYIGINLARLYCNIIYYFVRANTLVIAKIAHRITNLKPFKLINMQLRAATFS